MKTIKVGVVGIGAIAHIFHLPNYKNHPQVELAAVADIDFGRAQQAAEQWGAVAYESAEAMFREAGLDAVSICTFNKSHAELAIAALETGLDVLVEKPMTATAEEAARLVETAERTGRILMVGMSSRYRHDVRALKGIAESGELGDIYFAKARIIRRRGVPKGWFTSKELSGGGPMMDIGVHALDAAWWLMGMPDPDNVLGKLFHRIAPYETKVNGFYEAASVDNKTEEIYDVEDFGTAYITFANGAALTVEASWAANGAQDDAMKIELYGTKGGASLDPLFLFKESNLVPVESSLKVESNDYYKEEIDHFIQCVIHREQPVSDARQGLTIMRILDAIRVSSETNGAAKAASVE
ncbi:Gfo/Idh/MocA family protein [Paenibacillus sacheonensis]|uniref:Gfo/Idh/MocA family oxidoreductase n=1 Tax=Paenibacillus sacheonensis TaxID=742054 RepID=A0A7X4YNV4_9BACL|nr:Gfo/Idh/MocA family oxidoreductase [Paenibacillus sacheonensis]MBM7565847.1 putative dehydrogenase [Paenibacillus sacheonensis]NBC68834.1 Gfo/Idh/MocA family oxidoreductase [Paenibacillus sacheonensis]